MSRKAFWAGSTGERNRFNMIGRALAQHMLVHVEREFGLSFVLVFPQLPNSRRKFKP
jgi:hypothetical protein